MSTLEKQAVEAAMAGIGYTPSECAKLKRREIPITDGDVVEVDISGNGEFRKKFYTQQWGIGFSTKIACSTVELEKAKIDNALQFLKQTA